MRGWGEKMSENNSSFEELKIEEQETENEEKTSLSQKATGLSVFWRPNVLPPFSFRLWVLLFL